MSDGMLGFILFVVGAVALLLFILSRRNKKYSGVQRTDTGKSTPVDTITKG
jgi:hypothetical protein